MRRFIAAVALLSATAVNAASPLQSTYTDLSRKVCPNDFNRPLNQLAEHQAITYRCKGIAGTQVTIRYGGNFVDVSINGGGLTWQGNALRAGYDVGERMEWLGLQTAKGFSIRAGVLRLRRRVDSGRLSDALAILVRDGAKICVAAFLDGASPKANELARAAAGELAGTFRCGQDHPSAHGPVSDPLKEVLEENT